ncbi:MAG: MBL fold metallo-hydrolase [bacterium]|nr:MBL fold metallo-hydrolase [bacterium]
MPVFLILFVHKKKIILIILLCLVAAIGTYFYIQIDTANRKSFQITFFNIGQGDSALIRFADGEKMLVDCGPDNTIIQKLGQALPFYDRQIDYLLVTHSHLDHYGGCPEVLKRYKITKIFTNGETEISDPNWRAWGKYVNSERAEAISAPSEMTIGGARLEFLFPDASLPLDSKILTGNNDSIVFRLSNAGKNYLFTGDAEAPIEEALLNRYCADQPVDCPALRSDFLKAGHHGSDTSSGEKFLAAVAPKQALISVGKNSYGHPSFRVLMRMKRAGVEVWRTDELGDMVVQ